MFSLSQWTLKKKVWTLFPLLNIMPKSWKFSHWPSKCSKGKWAQIWLKILISFAPPSVLAGVRHRSPHHPRLRLTRPLARLHECSQHGKTRQGPACWKLKGNTLFKRKIIIQDMRTMYKPGFQPPGLFLVVKGLKNSDPWRIQESNIWIYNLH